MLFNFPPNAGNTGTAAFLSVFESLHNTLIAMKAAGYTVDLPASTDDLRECILHGNAERYGATANVHARIPANDHVRRERWLNVNSFGAYLLFTLVLGGAFLTLYRSRAWRTRRSTFVTHRKEAP